MKVEDQIAVSTAQTTGHLMKSEINILKTFLYISLTQSGCSLPPENKNGINMHYKA